MDFAGGVFALVWLMFFALIIPFFFIYVIGAVAQMLLMQKAGSTKSWAAWVPVYNIWTFLELGKQPGWPALAVLGIFLLLPIPFVGGLLYALALIFLIITHILAVINVNKQFNKDSGGWHVFGVLLFPIWAFVLQGEKTPANPHVPGQLVPITGFFKATPTAPVNPVYNQQHNPGGAYPQAQPYNTPYAPASTPGAYTAAPYSPQGYDAPGDYEKLAAAEPVQPSSTLPPVPPPPPAETAQVLPPVPPPPPVEPSTESDNK